MENRIKATFVVLLAIGCIGPAIGIGYSSGARRTCRQYSRCSGQWKTWDCGPANSYPYGEVQNGKPLQYGHVYRGLGQISTPQECARTCQVGESPKNCYYQFTVELYRTFGAACELCQPSDNTSLAETCECLIADGVDVAGKILINRQYPGPSIQVCLGDYVIIDVFNRVTGNALTVHWHGIYQNGYQWYDGTPFVTQCPIMFGTNFRYQWRAQNSGTHFYHAHTGLHEPDGLDGPIIIRVPRSVEPNRNNYDEDRFDTFMFLKDWMHDGAQDHWPGTTIRHISQTPDNILVNGKGQWFNTTTNSFTNGSSAVFNVEPNRRYRFRMINGFSFLCSGSLTIENHNLTIIATDGDDVLPRTVTSIVSSAAERFDFVVNTNQKPGNYWIQLRLFGIGCLATGLTQVAILRYTGAPLQSPQTTRPRANNPGLPLGIVLNNLNQVCDGRNPTQVCITNLQAAESVSSRYFAKKADLTIFAPIGFYYFTPQELFGPGSFQVFEAPLGYNPNVASQISNLTHVFPPSPYISQFNDIPPDTICNINRIPKRCQPNKPCYCSHIIQNIPLNSLVEIIIIDTVNIQLDHPFHLHGYGFHVMAQGNLSDLRITRENAPQALQLHAAKFGPLNPRPPVKDTLTLTSNGYTIVRFIADNPGFWLYHCHFRTHQLSGMEVTLQVGTQRDLPPKPPGFPVCGNFMPNV